MSLGEGKCGLSFDAYYVLTILTIKTISVFPTAILFAIYLWWFARIYWRGEGYIRSWNRRIIENESCNTSRQIAIADCESSVNQVLSAVLSTDTTIVITSSCRANGKVVLNVSFLRCFMAVEFFVRLKKYKTIRRKIKEEVFENWFGSCIFRYQLSIDSVWQKLSYFYRLIGDVNQQKIKKNQTSTVTQLRCRFSPLTSQAYQYEITTFYN